MNARPQGDEGSAWLRAFLDQVCAGADARLRSFQALPPEQQALQIAAARKAVADMHRMEDE